MDEKVEPEVIIIDDDTEVLVPLKPKERHIEHTRNEKQKPKRKVKINTTPFNKETLVITHWVKPKFKCIINVTNMYEHKRSHKDREREYKVSKHIERNNNNCKKVKLSKCSSEERFVPHCLRRCCKSVILAKACRNRREKYMLNERETISRNSYNYSCCSKYGTANDRQQISVHTNLERDRDISYDDISSDSLSSYVNNSLEKLIERTKKRDRTLNMTRNDQVPVCASTPKQSYSADTEDATVQIEANTSLHSMTTLVLETRSTVTPVTSPMCLEDFENISSYSPNVSSISSPAKLEVYSPNYAAELSPVHGKSEQNYKPALAARSKIECTPCATMNPENYLISKIDNPAVKTENVTTSLVCTKSEHVEDGKERQGNYISAMNTYASRHNNAQNYNLSKELEESQNIKPKTEVFNADYISIKVEKDDFRNNNQHIFSETSIGINYPLVNVKQERS